MGQAAEGVAKPSVPWIAIAARQYPAYREPSALKQPSVPRTRRESPSGARPEIVDFGRSAGRSSASPQSASPLQATCRRPGDRVSAAPMAARAPRRGGPPEKACIPGFARCRTRSTERLCCPLLACGALRRRTRRGATGTYSCVPRRAMAGSTAGDAPGRSLATGWRLRHPLRADIVRMKPDLRGTCILPNSATQSP